MTLREIVPSDAAFLARLHLAAFPGFFLSELGLSFLTLFYLRVAQTPSSLSAVAVDEEALAGFGTTAAAARDDLRGFLEWAHRKRRDTPVPDFRDPQLHTFKVAVRPEYRTRQRIYPSAARGKRTRDSSCRRNDKCIWMTNPADTILL